MAENKIFSFDDLTEKDKLIREIKREFKKLNCEVVQVDISSSVKRTAGVSYKEISMTFADSQVVTFGVKKTGDIYRVKLNKKDLPIKNQDEQKKAFKEIAAAMDKGRTAFQKKLARTKITPPAGVRTAKPKLIEQLKEQQASIAAASEEADKRIAELKAQIQEERDAIARINQGVAA